MEEMAIIHKRDGANLPHWTREGATYFTTFRLADSLPSAAVNQLRSESRLLDRKLALESLTPEELLRRAKLKSAAYLNLLDRAHGECLLRRDDVAAIVADALQHFHEHRYRLWAWCIMPNHVHVVFTVPGTAALSGILHSWKSFTAKAINKLLGRSGAFWQAEYYDHLVRDEADFQHAMAYTLNNPVEAGLKNWKWVRSYEATT